MQAMAAPPRPTLPRALLAACLLLPWAVQAQAPVPAPAAAAASAPAVAGEPKVDRLVAEDDAVRIEELRVRGVTQRIVVHSKQGGRPYEVLPAEGGRDLSQDKRATGQRVWSVFRF